MSMRFFFSFSWLYLANIQVSVCRTIGPLGFWFLSSPEPLGSQGELIVYQSSQRPSVRRRPSAVRSQCSKIFFSETALPIKAKYYVEPPWVGETIFCSRHLGHMTKMAATPLYGKNHSKYSSPEPVGRFSRNLVCSIGDSSPS